MGFRLVLQFLFLLAFGISASLFFAKAGLDLPDQESHSSFEQDVTSIRKASAAGDPSLPEEVAKFREKYLPDMTPTLVAIAMVAMVLFVTIMFLVECYFYAALYYAVIDQEATLVTALKAGVREYLGFTLVFSILMTFVTLGMTFFLLPGIIAMAWFVLAPYAYFSEGYRSWSALARSKELVRGNTVALLVRVFASMVVFMAVLFFINVLPKLLLGTSLAFLQQLAMMFLIPFFLIYYYLIYADLRQLQPSENKPTEEDTGPVE